jgi:hypothetical protein
MKNRLRLLFLVRTEFDLHSSLPLIDVEWRLTIEARAFCRELSSKTGGASPRRQRVSQVSE